jgi:hypothetical protein
MVAGVVDSVSGEIAIFNTGYDEHFYKFSPHILHQMGRMKIQLK